MTAFNGITGDLQVNPPRGINESRVLMNGETIRQYTYLCSDNDSCFAIGFSKVSGPDAALQVVGSHACPAPMRYSVIPTGKSLLEKLWDTGDLALRALKDGTGYPTLNDTEPEKLKGFISGVAEAIAITAVPYFRIQREVLIELNRRYQMHIGKLPFSPTPSYRFNPATIEYRPLQEAKDDASVRNPPTARPAAKRRPAKTVKPEEIIAPRVIAKVFTEAEEEQMRQLVADGKVTAEQLSTLYSISPARVDFILNPPSNDLPPLFG